MYCRVGIILCLFILGVFSSLLEIKNDIGSNIQVSNIRTYPTHGISILLNPHTLLFTPIVGYQGYDYLIDNNGLKNITIYTMCPLTPVLFSYTPYPVVDISISHGSILYPSFSILLPYYRENVGYNIDLCDPLLGTSPCGTSPVSSYISAPTASFPGAVGTISYPAYNNGNNIWGVSAENCSHVEYQSNMTFSTLSTCILGSSSCINISYTGNSQVNYNGNLFISMMQDGYPIQRWIYPFTFTLVLSNTVLLSGNMQTLIRIYPISIVSGSSLTIQVRTITATSNRYARSLLYPSFFSLTSILPSPDAKTQMQTWIYTSQNGTACNWIGTTCTYSFSWTVYPDNKIVSAQVSVTPIPDPTILQGNISAVINMYDDPKFTSLHNGSIWYSNTLYIAPILISNIPQSISIVDAYICFPSDPNTILTYDPNQGEFGCLQDFLVSSGNLMHIISNGNAINGSGWNINVYSNLILQGKNTMGISLELINPQVGITYYFHIVLGIGSSKRNMMLAMNSAYETEISGFMFGTPINQSNSITIDLLLYILIPVLITLLLLSAIGVCLGILICRRR